MKIPPALLSSDFVPTDASRTIVQAMQKDPEMRKFLVRITANPDAQPTVREVVEGMLTAVFNAMNRTGDNLPPQ